MPLLNLWKSNPQAINELSIEQIVSAAGDGNLKDSSPCSHEFREYLAQASSQKISNYIDGCLTRKLEKGGMILQDLINELGRRLDYKVTNGRYQGTSNVIGNDGLWISPEGHSIVIEVKTTDAYRISLDTIAAYREKLQATKQISSSSSILIIVGREDTGELEAQVRGSKHAWDIRLISADALIKLVQLKENSDEKETGKKIRSLLTPMEYTRLDPMIDVMFTTVKDVESAVTPEAEVKEEKAEVIEHALHPKGTWEFTESAVLEAKRDAIFSALGRREGTSFIKQTRAQYWNSDHRIRAICTISKRYTRYLPAFRYWYAYHPQWDEFLSEGEKAFFVLGCVDLNIAFALPRDVMKSSLEYLDTTEKEDGQKYWHVHLSGETEASIALLLSKRKTTLPLNKYVIKLS